MHNYWKKALNMPEPNHPTKLEAGQSATTQIYIYIYIHSSIYPYLSIYIYLAI